MFNTSNKLFDQIFELKFTAKQLIKESKRCESEEKAQKVKAKQAMVKGEWPAPRSTRLSLAEATEASRPAPPLQGRSLRASLAPSPPSP